MCDIIKNVKSQLYPIYHNRIEEILSCMDKENLSIKVTHSPETFVAILQSNKYGEDRIQYELREMSGKLERFPTLSIKGDFVVVLKVERGPSDTEPSRLLVIYEGRGFIC